uniref:Putative ovule protein n=1 Tax=Solanum chacoense TaxID=4108 RepID=A0A0V0HKJ7_SOLCH
MIKTCQIPIHDCHISHFSTVLTPLFCGEPYYIHFSHGNERHNIQPQSHSRGNDRQTSSGKNSLNNLNTPSVHMPIYVTYFPF